MSSLPLFDKPKTQHEMIIDHFQRGGRLTVATALALYGIYALSQRCGELARDGWPIESRTVRNEKKKYSEYWMQPGTVLRPKG
jgi:hypothetical protein